MTLSIADPGDTINPTLDSVKVYLEQHVSDPTRGFWYIIPIINGTPGTTTLEQAGSLADSLLCFDISGDITGWADLIRLSIDLYPLKGAGAPPQWYADYLYVYAYKTGILENDLDKIASPTFFVPTIAKNELALTYHLNKPGNISLEIYNSMGGKVFDKKINGNEGTNTITLKEIGQFASGVYYLMLKSINLKGIEKIATGRFIVLN